MKKRVITVATVAVVGLSSVFISTPTYAETVDELENQQTQIEAEREELKSTLSNAEKEIADILIDLEELNEEIEKVSEALEKNKEALKENEEEVETTEEEIEQLEEEIKDLEDQIQLRFDILKERAASYQKNGGNISYLEVLFGAQNFTDFISRIGAINKITESDANLIEQIDADKAKVEEKQEEVETKLDELKQLGIDLQVVKQAIEDQQEANKERKEELKDKEETLVATVEELEMEDSELASLQEELQINIEAARQPARETQVASATTDNEEETSSNEESSSSSSNNNSSSNNSSSSNDTSNSNYSNNSNSSSNNSSSNSNVTAKPKSEPKPSPAPKSSGGGGASAAISAGKTQIGTPYVWGGKSPGGFDCSGFVAWAYGQAGVSLPSYTQALLGVGTPVSASNLSAGDLVFFDTAGPGSNSHVGIYIGGGNFIGAQTSTGVKIESLTSGYWAGQFKGVARSIN